MISIFWNSPDEGYYDLLPESLFSEEGSVPVVEHEILSPGESPTRARCSLTVEGRTAILDYRPEQFAAFNRVNDTYRGTMRIHFSDATRRRVTGVEWRGWGDSAFAPAPVSFPPLIVTSEMLLEGGIYAREDLSAIFDITDATLNTGVFQPKGTKSIWLFVTERKTSDRTQYEDRLDGDLLHWEGQTSGRTDAKVVGHDADGTELLVFYRRSKREHRKGGFRFEGRFRYLSHQKGSPSSFILRRIGKVAETEADPFDPTDVEDGRKKVLAMVAQRQGQGVFRRKLLKAYGGRCALTDCDVEAVLQAAHIHPYLGERTNDVTNGLLLRADLHTLLDLGLLTFDDERRLKVDEKLKGTSYWELHGRLLNSTMRSAEAASVHALQWHRSEASSRKSGG